MTTYPLPDHPDSPQEAAHLAETYAIICREKHRLEEETHTRAEEEQTVVIPADATMDEQVMLDILRMKLDTLHQVAMASHQAYFARLDFTPEGGQLQTHYLGRWGVTAMPDFDTVVVDWRSPLANLYYSGQVGPMRYEAPDGVVCGELSLKRMLTVREERLISLFDSGVVSQDAYLQGVLGEVSSDRLREIVTTIQSEQNLVIRHPLRQSLIVQGVAGSGKTTIALHRIAWLLYAFRDTLRPEQLMILAPNPLFLSYISQVLPDLGVERVHQTTFAELCRQWMGKKAPRLQLNSRLEERLDTGMDAEVAQVLRWKGSLACKASVEAFLAAWQQELMPREGLVFGGHVLYTWEEVQQIFLKQLNPFPLSARITELKKYVSRRLKVVCGQMKASLESMAQARLTKLLETMPDGAERRERATKLLDSRDARVAEVDVRAKDYLKHFAELFPDLSLLKVYREYLLRCESAEVQAVTLPLLDKGCVQAEDLAALCVICRAVEGIRGEHIRHIVMDECQDFSPFQLAVLRDACPAATFTLVGDLMQGIHAEEGIDSYDAWLEPVFHGEAMLRQLVSSYRNTVEIMTLASRISARHPVHGETMPKPVLRHGEAPTLRTFPNPKARNAALIEQVTAWQQAGYHTIALITKTQAEAAALYRVLKKELHVQLMDEKTHDYAGGVLLLPAAMVKGLEFDCVAVCDASAEAFPDDPFLCRMLYVICTRPLHRLSLFAVGAPSPLLGDDIAAGE